MKTRKTPLLLLFLFLFFSSNAQELDTTLTIEEVEIIGKVEQKGGIVEFFGEIFDLQMLKRSFRSYSLRFNGNLRDAKNTFQDSTGIHVYIRPLLQNDAFWPNIFQKIAERFYVDKINPSLEYKIWFTPVDTVQFKSNINPIAQSLDPNNPEDFGIMDDPIELIAHYDTVRAHTIDTLINLFNNAVYDSLPGQDSSAWLVQFYPAPGQTYGYDQYSDEEKYAGLRSTYVPHTIGGQSRYLSYKSIERFQTDQVYAFCPDKSIDVKFKLEGAAGQVIVSPVTGTDTLKIDISGIQSEGEYDIIAYYEDGDNDVEIGRVCIVAYPGNKVYNLVLVPVNGQILNGTSEASIRSKLNKIYAQAVVKWNVSTHSGIQVLYDEDGDQTFHVIPKDQSIYTTDMQMAIDRLGVTPSENTYYMFVLDGTDLYTNNKDTLPIMGLMPFFQPYGFIFMNTFQNEKEIIKTIAHELGHGVFGLEHEFFIYPSIDRGDPNLTNWNATNTNIRKYQWDWIQKPFCLMVGNCGQGGLAANVDIDSEEKSETKEFFDNNFMSFIRAIKIIRCAKNNNLNKANIYFQVDNFRIDIGSISNALGWTTQDFPNEEVEILISNNGGLGLTSYFEDNFNVNTISFSNYKAVLQGEKEVLIFRAPINSNRKEYVYNFIKQFLNNDIPINPIPHTSPNTLTIDELHYEPFCTYELINDDRRKTLLFSISENSKINYKKEKIAINLLKSAINKKEFYDIINTYKNLTLKFYDDIDVYRNELFSTLSSLCSFVWSQSDYENAEYFILGEYLLDSFYPEFTKQYYDNNLLKVAGCFYTEEGVYKFGSLVMGSNDSGHTWPESSDCLNVFEVNALSPIVVNISDKQGVLPAITVKHLAKNLSDQNFWNFIAFHTGLLLPELYISRNARLFRGIGWSDEGVLIIGSERFYTNIEDFKVAINQGDNVFYIGYHTDIVPRPTGVQSHHGVNSAWMDSKYINYNPNNAPTVYMLNNPNHNATRGVFNRWAAEKRRIQGSKKVDYTKISEDEIIDLANRQFDAADVPQIVRDEYFNRWETYKNELTLK